MAANLCTFDSTLTTFDSTARTFDQTTCSGAVSPDTGEQPAGGTRRRKRLQYRVRYNGQEYEAYSLAEVEDLIVQFRAQAAEELAQLPPRQKRRKAKRPIAKIEIPQELQQELYRHDLPNVAPMLEAFDFAALRAVMARLEAIREQIEQDDEEDILLWT
jgi:hypothetical protein